MTIFRLKTQGAERETDQIQRGKLSKERNTRDPTEVSRAGVTIEPRRVSTRFDDKPAHTTHNPYR